MWAIQWPYIFNSDIISLFDVIPLRSYTNALITLHFVFGIEKTFIINIKIE